MRYRTVPQRPVEVEARQLTADNIAELELWSLGTWYGNGRCLAVGERGDMARAGDWVVQATDGSFSVVRDGDFLRRFEEVPA